MPPGSGPVLTQPDTALSARDIAHTRRPWPCPCHEGQDPGRDGSAVPPGFGGTVRTARSRSAATPRAIPSPARRNGGCPFPGNGLRTPAAGSHRCPARGHAPRRVTGPGPARHADPGHRAAGCGGRYRPRHRRPAGPGRLTRSPIPGTPMVCSCRHRRKPGPGAKATGRPRRTPDPRESPGPRSRRRTLAGPRSARPTPDRPVWKAAMVRAWTAPRRSVAHQPPLHDERHRVLAVIGTADVGIDCGGVQGRVGVCQCRVRSRPGAGVRCCRLRCQTAHQPLSTGRTVPLMLPAASEARKTMAPATSSADAPRPTLFA